MSENHFEVLNKYLPLLNALPYSRAFFLVGSLAKNRIRKESDIDLVVLAQKNRVWLNRIFLILAVTLIGRRRMANKRACRFCFNASLAQAENDLIAKIYRHNKPLQVHSGFLSNLRNIAETLLEVTFLGVTLDWLAQKIISKYVLFRFARFKNNQSAICILEQNKIVYHPPRLL